MTDRLSAEERKNAWNFIHSFAGYDENDKVDTTCLLQNDHEALAAENAALRARPVPDEVREAWERNDAHMMPHGFSMHMTAADFATIDAYLRGDAE